VIRRLCSIVVVAAALGAIGAATSQDVLAQPPDPPHGRYIGSTLVCDDGYKPRGRRCVKLPPVEHGHYVGSILVCDDRYEARGYRCVKLPANGHGDYIGSTLVCDDGYEARGYRCVKLPAVRHGDYIGSTLVCDDGYEASGYRCVSLRAPPHGTYLGSILLCDPGYRQVTPRKCRRGPTNATSIGRYVALCRTDVLATNGRCLKITSTAYRARPTVVPPRLRPPLCAEDGSCYGDISNATLRPKTVYVRSYVRDGTYIRSHFRSLPRVWR
jgi:hypothetical protein